MRRYPNLFGEKPEELAYGFDDFCTYYDSQFCYRIEQFTPARWTGYISWHDWGQRESSLWGLEPSRLIANAIAHMRARQDFGRLQRFGDWIHLHETDPELYGQNLKELCARVNGFNLYAKSQHRLVFDPLDNAGGVTLSSNSISNASPTDLTKPLTAKLTAGRAMLSSGDDARASLIAMAKGFAPEKAPIKGNFEDTKYMTASAAGKVADALKNIAVGLGAGASQIDFSLENGTGYSIPLDDYVPPRRHRDVEAEYHYPHKAAVLHDRVERATRERDLAMAEGKPQSTVDFYDRIRAEAQAELDEMESVAASPLPNRHENPAVSAGDKESLEIPPSIGDITELPETTGGIAAVEIDDSPYTTPAVPSEGWSTIYPDTSDEVDRSLVFSTSHDGGGLGSPAHKAQRWAEYQENGGTWSYERWSNVYDKNVVKASQAHAIVPNSSPSSFTNKFPEHEVGAPKLVSLDRLKSVNGSFNYVVTEDGRLVVGKKFDGVGGGHIDLANGQSVSAAGEVKVVQGQIKYIDNSSGHYEPYGNTAQTKAETAFQQLGFDISNKYVEKAWVPDPKLPRGGAWRPKQ